METVPVPSPGIKITNDLGDRMIIGSKISVEIPYYKDMKFAELAIRLVQAERALDQITVVVDTFKEEIKKLSELAQYMRTEGTISISLSPKSENEEKSG